MPTTTSLTVREKLLIGGRWSENSSREWSDVENPATGESIGRIPLATRSDVDQAVDMAAMLHKSKSWSNTPVSERAELLAKVASKIEERAAEFQELYVKDQGGTTSFAPFPVMTAALIFRDFAKLADEVKIGLERRDTSGGSVYISREPVGPVAAIVPWNAPMVLTPVKIAPTLLAGCPVIVKIPPEAPLAMFLLADIFAEVGVPGGLISFLPGDRLLGRYIISKPEIAHISFTGSTPAGQEVMKTAADQMSRVTLELGGKSAALVLDDAEPAEFASTIAQGSLAQSGQVCTAQTRILVPKSREQEWIAALREEFESMVVGDPSSPTTDIGPLISASQLNRVETYVGNARREGAEIIAGGAKPEGEEFTTGYWYLPTLVANTRPDMQVYREEVFGPVIVIDSYESVDDGIEAMNDSDYGLGGGIYTTDIDRAVSLAQRVESGTIGINSAGPTATAPFGGVKLSGMGREGGIEGVEAMLELKQINLPM